MEVASIAFTEICQRLIYQWPLVFKQQMESWECNQIWAFCFHILVMVLIQKKMKTNPFGKLFEDTTSNQLTHHYGMVVQRKMIQVYGTLFNQPNLRQNIFSLNMPPESNKQTYIYPTAITLLAEA